MCDESNDYICPRCNYVVSKKYNFIKHLNRKRVCSPKYSNMSILDIIIWYEII